MSEPEERIREHVEGLREPDGRWCSHCPRPAHLCTRWGICAECLFNEKDFGMKVISESIASKFTGCKIPPSRSELQSAIEDGMNQVLDEYQNWASENR